MTSFQHFDKKKTQNYEKTYFEKKFKVLENFEFLEKIEI